jgi:hypothetical protein
LVVANEDHGHVALPKLYGAPAYARPPITPVTRTERPLSPDDLPLESEQTAEERELVQNMAGYPRDGADDRAANARDERRHGRRFGLRSITGRVRRDNGAAAGG